jgi:enoyl-CoA hydratase
MLRVFEIARPVVAAVNGHAIAGSCVLALQADVRLIAERECKIGLNEVPLGIGLPAVVVEPLRAQLSQSSLSPIALEGRLLSPREALELALVHEVVPEAQLLPRALEKAAALADLPPAGFAQVKAALRTPAANALRAAGDADARRWTATWFTADAKARIEAAVSKLKK